MSTISTHPGRHASRTLSAIGAVIALAIALSTHAYCGNPAEEMAKMGKTTTTGGVDPNTDSWVSIQNSLHQFGHNGFLLRIFLSLSLAVGCAWAIGWHPRRAGLTDPLADIEERKALIILGMVGAIVAELSANNQTLAFVIFGIGALLRFRTVLDNPKLTGKAITVVIIGLACGIGSWVLAVFVTVFAWVLINRLESHVACRIRFRLRGEMDPRAAYGMVQSVLVAHHCHLESSTFSDSKGQMVFLLLMPSNLDPKLIEADVRTNLPKDDDSQITIQAA